jgi:hypothetical protein
VLVGARPMMHQGRVLVVLAALGSVALLGCGAREELSIPTSTHGCGSWTAAGPATMVSQPKGPAAIWFTAMIPSEGGALLTWLLVQPGADGVGITWYTRALDLDATPRSVINSDVSRFLMGQRTPGMVVLANGNTFRAFVGDPDHGCSLLPLDQDGAATGSPVSLVGSPSTDGCVHPAAAGNGFSFIRPDSPGNGPVPLTLESIGLDGEPEASKSLGSIPASTHADRYVLEDQSFLLVTFPEPNSLLAPQQVQHFAADGTPIAGALTRPKFPPIDALAQTKTGLLAGWLTPGTIKSPGQSIFVQTLNDDGASAGPPTSVVSAVDGDFVTAFTLVSAPNGDVVLGWMETPFPGDDSQVFVMVLGPDGSPRGSATSLGTFGFVGTGSLHVLVAPDGQLGLLAFEAVGSEDPLKVGVMAMPLVCAP